MKSINDSMECKICQNKSDKIFNLKVLGKYNVAYFQCKNCNFMQAEYSYRLEEAYDDLATAVDTGFLSRPLDLAKKTEKIIYKRFDRLGKFLDFGGGYGVFVRLMRDKGFDFYLYDKFYENIFAKYFDVGKDLNNINTKFELITAFEVFEHLDRPLPEIDRMFNLTDTILFSTTLIPPKRQNIKEWWYLSRETGGHISFYSKESLQIIASKFKANFYSDGEELHMLTRRKIKSPFVLYKNTKLLKILEGIRLLFCKNKNPSLTCKDQQKIKELVREKWSKISH